MGAITGQDIADYLATEDDFDLELFVYRAFRERGLASSHGGTYTDPATRKVRQFDLRVSATMGRGLGWGLNMAVECKSLSAEFPLVVSRVPRPEHESRHYLVRSWGRTAMGERFAESVLVDKGLRLYGAGIPVGKHTFQLRRDPKNAFKTGDSETYDKWSQALASAADLVELARDGHVRYHEEQFLTLILPILVVSDGTLWAVDYDEAGKRGEPKSVDECTLWVERVFKLKSEDPLSERNGYPITHLHIYTRQGFLSFLEGIDARRSLLVERMFRSAVR